jgi:ABC-type lipoprotein export system ATPase subunit
MKRSLATSKRHVKILAASFHGEKKFSELAAGQKQRLNRARMTDQQSRTLMREERIERFIAA